MTARAGRVTRAVRQGRSGLAEAYEVLARALDDPETPPAARPALARELRLLRREIEAKVEVSDDIDALAARRRARLSG